MSYTILPEFRDLLDPLDEVTRQRLKEKIELEGPHPRSLVVGRIFGDGDYVVDGHNTLSICAELGVQPPKPYVIPFASRQEAKEWMLTHQWARRNASSETRQALVLKLREEGMSTRRIAAALGVSQSTVARDLETDSGESNDSPEPHTNGQAVKGADGKTYQATKPAKKRKKNGAPVFDWKAFYGDYGRLYRRLDDFGDAFGGRGEYPCQQLREMLASVKNDLVALYKAKTGRKAPEM